jgi:hypothetical protein
MSLDERIKNQIDNINNIKEYLKDSYVKYYELMLLKFKDEFLIIDESVSNWFYFQSFEKDYTYTIKGYYALKKGKSISYENNNCIDYGLYGNFIDIIGYIDDKLNINNKRRCDITTYDSYSVLIFNIDSIKTGFIINNKCFRFYDQYQ